MKRLTVFPFFIMLAVSISGQSINELRNAESILWLGIDFTEARFEGEYDFGVPGDLTEKLIPGWNQVLLAEPEKFDIASMFNFSKVETDFGLTFKKNESINPENIFLNPTEIEKYSLTPEIIQDIVSKYDLDYNGYALIFIVESYSKTTISGNIWVTFFHVPSKKVVYTKKMAGEARGFGIKNYWTGAVYDVMKACNKQIDKLLED